jgi:gliding motility-associated-like protein
MFTATDGCGNTASTSASFTIIDTTPPTIDTDASNSTVECDGAGNTNEFDAWLASNGGATASEACSAITWSNDFNALSDDCGATGTATVMFTATDDCGNATTTSASFTIVDTTPPTINTDASNSTVECDGAGNTTEFDAWLASYGGATATDICANVTWTNDFNALSDDCGETGTATVIFTATDDCGNSSTSTASFTIVDTTPPTINTDASNSTVECDGTGNTAEFDAWLASNGGATATDICANVTWTNDFTALSDDCGATGSATVIFTATDDCGNIATTSASFTIVDTVVPELITALQTELTVSCADIPEVPTPGFADDCSEDVSVIYNETNYFDGTDNDYQIIREWTVTDDCSNTAVFTQTLNVTVEEIVTQVSDSRCTIDGDIDLNSYLASTDDDTGTWTVESGNTIVANNGVFDPENVDLGDYVFSYSVAADGCISVTEVTIEVNDECVVLPCGSDDVEISKAVTPNGDQWNEFFEIRGIEACDFTYEVKVFNRWGALIYESNNYQNDWNGSAHKSSIGNSDKVPAGTYYYIVNLKDSGLEPFTGPIYLGTK